MLAACGGASGGPGQARGALRLRYHLLHFCNDDDPYLQVLNLLSQDVVTRHDRDKSCWFEVLHFCYALSGLMEREILDYRAWAGDWIFAAFHDVLGFRPSTNAPD